jgi:hypothetical protein
MLPTCLTTTSWIATLRPLSDEAIEEIVDTIFLPLLGAARPA